MVQRSLLSYMIFFCATAAAVPASVPLAPLIHPPPHVELVKGRYIVQLKETATLADHIEDAALHDPMDPVIDLKHLQHISIYHAYMSDSLVQRVRRDPNVVVVEADAYYQHTGTNVTVVDDYSSDDALPELNKISKRGWSRQTQADAPWHLASISGTKVGTTQGPYDYISNAGEGVYVYVLDSGVFIDHPDFEGRAVHFKGRETSPWALNGNNQQETCMDERSHGTNSASIIAGAKHGVAKKATIVNVKISGSKGTNAAGVAEAIDEIIQEFGDYKRKKDPKFRGAVINMSLGIPGLDRSSSVGTSLKAAMGRGIHVVVAAGNENKELTSSPLFPCSWSLDDGFEALTCVGAFDKTYKKMEKSNYGPQVFLWAPGQSVRTAHWTDPNKEWAGSQTSAAAPSVAGIVATMVGFEGLKNKGDPKRVHDLLKENGLPGRFVTFTRDGGYGVLFANNGMNSGSSPYKGAPKDELRRRMA